MSFTAKQIEGGVVEKKNLNDYDLTDPYPLGYNSAIDAQSSVSFQFNREKLLKLLWEHAVFESGDDERLADAIIAADKEIIERAN